jgi:hypothetical protein
MMTEKAYRQMLDAQIQELIEKAAREPRVVKETEENENLLSALS